MNDNQLLSILQRTIGSGTPLKNGDVEFYCPLCHHHKKKMIINIDNSNKQFGSWHCWVCNSGGQGLSQLFKKANVSLLLEELSYLKSIFKSKRYVKEDDKTKSYLYLPSEFTSLLIPRPEDVEYRNAIHYARNIRKLTDYDIKRYNIGYCPEGKYSGRLIIPSYDINHNLNYFQARVYYEDADCLKFTNPPVEYNEIIGYENFINWNEPIVLCEGAMDGIAIRHNAIPGFGKNISNALVKKIYEKDVKDIYLFLDPDAIKNVISTAEKFFYEGKNIYIINYKTDEDASKLGYVKCQEHIKNATKLNESILLKLKIQNK